MQAFRLQSGEVMVICSCIQSGKYHQAPGSSKDNKTMVALQLSRETNQDWGEGCHT